MQSLLRWGIENSTPSTGAPSEPRKPLDPGILEHILGPPPAQLMRMAVKIAINEQKSESQRVDALEDLIELVDLIDNANDLSKIKVAVSDEPGFPEMPVWICLNKLLTAPSSTELIKLHTLWVIGTAVQNNPSAQNSFLELAPMPTILSFLQPEYSPATRQKAVYTLSSCLKHNSGAIQSFDDAGGWAALKSALVDSDIKVRRRTAFLLNTLLLPTYPITHSGLSAPFHTPTSGPAVHSPAAQNAAPVEDATPNPVFANSHASMLSDPSSISTSAPALAAMKGNINLLDYIIDALLDSVPFGADGDGQDDPEFESNCVRILYTYSVSCGASFDAVERQKLSRFFTEQEAKADLGDEDGDRLFGLSHSELEELMAILN